MYVVVNACCCQKMHSFIPNISIAPFQFTITQGLPRLQHLYCVAVNTLKRNRQLRAKDLPKVHTRRLEWESTLRGLGGVVVIDAAIGAHGRGSRLAHYFTVAATLDKSSTSHCLKLRQAPVRLLAVN